MKHSKLLLALTLSLAVTSMVSTKAKAENLNTWEVCPLQSEYRLDYSYWFVTPELWLSATDAITLADMVDSTLATQEICEWIQTSIHGADSRECANYWNPVIEQMDTNYFGVPGAPRDAQGDILRIFGFYNSTPQINYSGASPNGCF